MTSAVVRKHRRGEFMLKNGTVLVQEADVGTGTEGE